jgi:hypothetical protein
LSCFCVGDFLLRFFCYSAPAPGFSCLLGPSSFSQLIFPSVRSDPASDFFYRPRPHHRFTSRSIFGRRFHPTGARARSRFCRPVWLSVFLFTCKSSPVFFPLQDACRPIRSHTFDWSTGAVKTPYCYFLFTCQCWFLPSGSIFLSLSGSRFWICCRIAPRSRSDML